MGQPLMLKNIEIHNFAIISSVSLQFGAGLNIFTGETGAGKSIVIEALSFVLGARGDSGLIKQGKDKMSVKAEFSAEGLTEDILRKYKTEKDTFTLKREMDLKGRNKAWINDRPVLVGDLADLGAYLVDFHGQHEHQTLFKAAGGIRTLEDAMKMIEAGANRLGCSAGVDIVESL